MIGDVLPRERASVTMCVGESSVTTTSLPGKGYLPFPACRTIGGKTVGKGADSELRRELKEVMA